MKQDCSAWPLFLDSSFTHPLIFTSLGPTVYEIVETPTRQSAQPLNILAGHAGGIVAGIIAISLSHAWAVPAVSVHGVPMLRVVSVAIAACLTVIGTLSLKAQQPAALSTTLLIALGTMQTWHAIISIAASVGVLSIIAEPIRRRRVKTQSASA